MLKWVIEEIGEGTNKLTDVENINYEKMPFPKAYLDEVLKSREWTGKLHVTDLFNGQRETFLKYTTNYGIDPDKLAFAVSGTLKHRQLETENHSEIKIEYRNIVGSVDLIEKKQDGTYRLIDFKTVGAFAVRKFMGFQKIYVPVTDNYGVQVFYKSGKRKGEKKMKGVWIKDEASADREIYEWQLNIYRKGLEEQGIEISEQMIFFILRDGGLAATREQGLKRNTYFLKVKKLTDEQINAYIQEKGVTAEYINKYFEDPCEKNLEKLTPMMCTAKERWEDRETGLSKKCEFYCSVKDKCEKLRRKGI